jgi:hypothetical protein
MFEMRLNQSCVARYLIVFSFVIWSKLLKLLSKIKAIRKMTLDTRKGVPGEDPVIASKRVGLSVSARTYRVSPMLRSDASRLEKRIEGPNET